MTYKADGERLASFAASVNGFSFDQRTIRRSYSHMGATITDTILQAGLNYRTVVRPRVDQLISGHPTANTTTGFINVISFHGLSNLLRWDHEEKPRRIMELAWFLSNQGIETEIELRDWFGKPANCRMLFELRGMGPKSIDYLKMLIGIQCIPIDRHIRSFVKLAGLTYTQYDDVQRVVEIAADVLDVNRSSLDWAIWSYVSANADDRKNARNLVAVAP